MRLILKPHKSIRLILKAHKYIEKHKSPSGKWVYTYPYEKIGREPSEKVSTEFKELPSNEWANTYKLSIMTDKGYVALEIPYEYVQGVFTIHGLTFVVHNTITPGSVHLDEFKVAEITTGMDTGIEESDPKAAQDAAKNKLQGFTTEKIQTLVKDHEKIGTKPDVEFKGTVEEPTGYLLDDKSKQVIANMVMLGIGTKDEVKKWAIKRDVYLGEYFGTIDKDILYTAVEKDIDYDEAENYINIVNHLEAYTGSSLAQVMVWVDKYGISLEEYDWDDESEVLKYALENDISVVQAEKEVSGEREDYSEYEEGEIDGKTWNEATYQAVYKWLQGEDIKYMRIAVLMEDGTAREGDWVSDDFKNISTELLEHMWYLADEHTLYRGTDSDVWSLAKPGDVIPLGIASFSKSEKRAHGFAYNADGTVLTLEAPKGVRGIDFEGALQGYYSEEVGVSLGRLNLSHFTDEQEVLLRAPQVRVVEVVSPGGPGNEDSDRRKVVLEYIEPEDLTKAEKEMTDEERIWAMSDDFNKPLHREPEKQEKE